MSGFEIAGIALAVFPIIVTGLEHYAQGVQTIGDWRRYRMKLEDYVGQMESARVFYLDTLEELLTGIAESEDEMQTLMAKPGGPHWKQSLYDEKLKHRLGRSYEAYFRTLKVMIESLTQMCERLGVNTSGQVLWDDYSMIQRALKRIKITLRKKIYKELLDDIDKANKDIRDITHQNMYLEPVRKKRQSKRPIAEFKLIKDHAASLFQVLITGKGWKCGCKDVHLASLRLEPRPQMFEVGRANSAPACRFRVLLCTSLEGGSPPKTTSQWQEIEVAPSLDETGIFTANNSAQNTTRSVRFAPVVGKNVTEATISPEYLTDCNPIRDICTTLCTSHEFKEVMGFLVDEENEARRHYIYRADTKIASEPQSRSLGELLSSAGQTPFTISLSRGDRLQISVTLASSVLQLDGTSWLASEWTSSDIYFHNKGGGNKASGISYTYPYLPWRICTANSNLPPSMDFCRLEHLRDRCQVLLALGLILVELCFGRTLSEMEKPEDHDTNENVTKYSTARRLLNSVYNEMGTSYGDVVRRCLIQPFDVREMTLDNEELQQKVFEDIVTPLAEDLKHFTGSSGGI